MSQDILGAILCASLMILLRMLPAIKRNIYGSWESVESFVEPFGGLGSYNVKQFFKPDGTPTEKFRFYVGGWIFPVPEKLFYWYVNRL